MFGKVAAGAVHIIFLRHTTHQVAVPKTIAQKIVAIVKSNTSKKVARNAIKSELKSHYQVVNNAAINKALAKLSSKEVGYLVKNGDSFSVNENIISGR